MPTTGTTTPLTPSSADVTRDAVHVTSERSNLQPLAPAVVLIGIGVLLLLVALFSSQWLESVNAQVRFRVGETYAPSIGLFTNVSSHHAAFRWPIVWLLAGTPLFILIGLFARWALYAALACAGMGALGASWWVFAQTDVSAGRGYTLAMVGLAVIACGVTQVLMLPIKRGKGRNEVGDFVDGRKHGRWHLYDDAGICIAVEQWDHGKLVSSEPTRIATQS